MNSTLTASPARMTTQRIAWSTALIGGAVAAGAALRCGSSLCLWPESTWRYRSAEP